MCRVCAVSTCGGLGGGLWAGGERARHKIHGLGVVSVRGQGYGMACVRQRSVSAGRRGGRERAHLSSIGPQGV